MGSFPTIGFRPVEYEDEVCLCRHSRHLVCCILRRCGRHRVLRFLLLAHSVRLESLRAQWLPRPPLPLSNPSRRSPMMPRQALCLLPLAHRQSTVAIKASAQRSRRLQGLHPQPPPRMMIPVSHRMGIIP
jgi:hypothetical protein